MGRASQRAGSSFTIYSTIPFGTVRRVGGQTRGVRSAPLPPRWETYAASLPPIDRRGVFGAFHASASHVRYFGRRPRISPTNDRRSRSAGVPNLTLFGVWGFPLVLYTVAGVINARGMGKIVPCSPFESHRASPHLLVPFTFPHTTSGTVGIRALGSQTCVRSSFPLPSTSSPCGLKSSTQVLVQIF